MNVKDTSVPKLLLVERIEEIVDENGRLKSTDSDMVIRESKRIISEVANHLEAAETRISRLDPAKASQSAVKTHSFGGYEVLDFTRELVFILGGSGITAGIFGLLKAWIELKKGRRLVVEKIDKDGQTRRVEATGFDEKTIIRLLAENMSEANKKAEKKKSR